MNNSIKTTVQPSVPMAQQQYGVVAQPVPSHVVYSGMAGGIGVGGGGLVGGAGLGVGGGGQVFQGGAINNPNFGISLNGNVMFRMDPDAKITGIPGVNRVTFDSRTDVEAYYGDQFKIGEELYTTDFDLSLGKNEFHFLVWKALWGETIRDYGFIMLLPKPKTILAFTTRDSRDQFVSWFETYQERYPDRNTTEWRVPPICQGRTGGCFADRKEFDEAEVVQVWAWIIGHCGGSAAFLPNFILFDGENDAVMYRLRWG